MINHIWSVLCERSIIDKDSKNISLIEVIEQLNVRGDAVDRVIPIRLFLVTLWERSSKSDPVRASARLRFLDPQGNLVEKSEWKYSIDFKDYTRMRFRYAMNGLKVKGQGRHCFHLALYREKEKKWNQVATIPVLINIIEGDRKKSGGD